MPKKSSGSVADTNRASYSEYEVEEFTIDEEPVSYTHLTLPTILLV